MSVIKTANLTTYKTLTEPILMPLFRLPLPTTTVILIAGLFVFCIFFLIAGFLWATISAVLVGFVVWMYLLRQFNKDPDYLKIKASKSKRKNPQQKVRLYVS